MSIENRQKIPVPRRSFLWSLNETSGEILTHVGPTEFTPSANDRIVRSNDRGGFETAPMEARPFVVARDGEYALLANPIAGSATDELANGSFIPGGNKERELTLGTTRVVPGPCAFPLWPGQSAEVRPAHKLGANHYLLVEVVGPLDDKARYYRLVIESAGLSSAVIDAGEAEPRDAAPGLSPSSAAHPPAQLRLGQRIVIQGRHTQLFVPPSGIEIVPPIEDGDPTPAHGGDEASALATLSPAAAQECSRLVAQVREGLTARAFGVLKNELRHRQDLSSGERAVMLAALDAAQEERQRVRPVRGERVERRQAPADPYARRAVVLGPKEFCILFDADGNPRIVRGPARVFPGPHDTFLHRGSRRRVYDAYELAEHQALWLRVITPIGRERLRQFLPPGMDLDREQYEAGHELIVRGRPSVLFPFIEAEVLHPVTREPHVGNDHESVVLSAIGIDQRSAIYVRDLRTGLVKMVRGETSYLVDPRFEEHVDRRVAREPWNLWVGRSEPHRATAEEAVTTPWAISVIVPSHEACLVSSRHGRRVEIGPKVVLLEFEEELAALRLSKGAAKDGHQTVATCFLRVAGARTSDVFEIESADFVRFRVRLGLGGRFEGEAEAWFAVEDPVKLLAGVVRAQVRDAARREPAARLVAALPEIVRAALLPGGEPLRFVENGMVLDRVDVLGSQIADPALAGLFGGVQRAAIELELKATEADRRLASLRHQDEVDLEEHRIVRAAVARKAESRVVESDAEHAVALRALETKHARELVVLDFEVRSERELAASTADKLVREAEAGARAAAIGHRTDEAHRAAIAAVERDLARAYAESDAVRLGAIQKELVAALYAAADSEVLKAAANNMNLVALLGGKSPAELLGHVVKGTPLERSLREMRARAEAGGEGGEE